MSSNIDLILDIIGEAAHNAVTEPAEAGFFLLNAYFPDVDGQRIAGWRYVSRPDFFSARFPVTEDGKLHLGNPFIQKPDGSVEIIGVFLGGGDAGPWQSLEEWRDWIFYGAYGCNLALSRNDVEQLSAYLYRYAKQLASDSEGQASKRDSLLKLAREVRASAPAFTRDDYPF